MTTHFYITKTGDIYRVYLQEDFDKYLIGKYLNREEALSCIEQNKRFIVSGHADKIECFPPRN